MLKKQLLVPTVKISEINERQFVDQSVSNVLLGLRVVKRPFLNVGCLETVKTAMLRPSFSESFLQEEEIGQNKLRKWGRTRNEGVGK